MSDQPASPEPANVEAVAELGFEPWSHREGEWKPPTNEEWAKLANPHLISLRLAWLTVHKSKEELIGVAEQLGDVALMDVVGQIGRTADWFKGLHALMSCAECRIMSAYATRVVQTEGRPAV